MSKQYFVYIIANKKNGTLYIGVTSDLIKRISEHKSYLIEGFSKRYKLHLLVYYEEFDEVEQAIAREKRLKKWNRTWKIRLIEGINPNWDDLYDEII